MRPNILYLHSHDTGRLIQPHGHPVSTPGLQRFAEQGVMFRRAFCVSPTCSPSRAGLLTGRYPHCVGMHGLASPAWGYRLDRPEQLLAHVLAAAGYHTALGGVQHLAKPPAGDIQSLGYREFLHEADVGEDVPDLEQRAAAFLRRRHDRPWYLAVGFDETHRDNRQGQPDTGTRFSKHTPYDPAKLDDRYVLPPPGLPDLPEIRRDMASFAFGVRRLDERIAVVLAALEDSGAADHTLVLITTDHGPAWPGMKCNLSEQGLGVMLLLRGPGGFTSGRVVDALVTHLDVFPTLCEVAGLPRPDGLAGSSLLPLVAGRTRRLHDAIFAEQGWHEIAEAGRAVRTERFKFIRRHDPIGPKARNCDESPAKRVLAGYDFFDRQLGLEQLFDLHLDPGEAHNLVDDPNCEFLLQDMRRRLREWMERTGDPLLHGEPPPPPMQRPSAVAAK